MNKKLLLLISAISFVISNVYTQTGWDCQQAYIIPSVPYSATDLNSQVVQNIYSATSCSNNVAYMTGKDFVMSYTPVSDIYINIDVTNTAQLFTGLFVFNNCPDQPASCVTSNGSGFGLSVSLTNVFLTAGTTYYIIVSTNTSLGAPDYVMFDLDITEAVHDGGINLISAPLSNCGMTGNEAVSISIHNYGAYAISNFPVKYKINSGSEVVETFTGSIAVNGNANYTFTALADFSVSGTYTLQTYTGVTGDNNHLNDTTTATIISTQGVSVFPYEEFFDSGSTFWTIGGISPSWEIRNPVKQYINQPVSDTACFVTNGTGFCNTGEDSYIESPCFDMSLLINPVLEMTIWYENAPDGSTFLSSLDNGITWQNVMPNTGSANWYNENGQWSGNTHKWMIVKRNLSEFAGQPSVKFRFTFQSPAGGVDGFAMDNFRIAECSPLPIADFSYTANGSSVSFQNNSVNSMTFLWSFGDGSVSEQAYASHTYSSSGIYTVKLIVYNSCGSDTIVQTIDVVTSVIMNKTDDVSIYPNPATNKVYIKTGNINKANLEISNIQGKFILKKNISSAHQTIILDNLAQGVYIVKVSNESDVSIVKLVIE